MFRLGVGALPPGSRFERFDDVVVDISDNQVCHTPFNGIR